MLTTNIALAQRYDSQNERFRKAFDFLKTADLKNLPLGNTPIDGEDVYANVQAYTTLPDEEALFESHRAYFDVQYVVEGEERFGYVSREACVPTMEYDAARDLLFYREPEQSGSIVLKAGDFAIVSPEEAHAPRRQTSNGACVVRKIVIKVKV